MTLTTRLKRLFKPSPVIINGTGVHQDTGFNLFFQFDYTGSRYNLKAVEKAAKTRYNLKKVVILGITQIEYSAKQESNSINKVVSMDKIQYLQLT